LVEAVFAPFERAAAFEAFNHWQQTLAASALDQAVQLALPCVGFAYRILFLQQARIRKLDPMTRDELLAGGAAEVFERLRNKRDFVGDADAYERYLVATARRLMSGMCPRPEVLDYDVSSLWHPMGRVRDIRDVEYQLLLEKLPTLLWRYFRDQCRLVGSERHAAADVLRRMLSGRGLGLMRLKQQFRVLDPDFIVNYVLVLVRRFLYELRAEYGRIVEVPTEWAPVWGGGGGGDGSRTTGR